MEWARRTIESGGRSVTGEPQQFRHWSIASIWRIPTDGGDAWFKAVPPMFAREGAVIDLLAPSMPEHLPELIAMDAARGWTLMEALPARTLATFESKEEGAQYDEPVRVLAVGATPGQVYEPPEFTHEGSSALPLNKEEMEAVKAAKA